MKLTSLSIILYAIFMAMEQTEAEIAKKAEKKESPWELVRFILAALLIMIPIRMFVIQPFVVSGSSMFPTFEDRNYLIVDEISYKLGSPDRYDVVIFRYPNDPKKFFIKRIIGLPNETVDIKKGVVTIKNSENPEGFELSQPYVKNASYDDAHAELKDKEYFVMGDNRSASSDSRYWGAVPQKLLVGKALVRLWPVSNIDMWPGEYVESTEAR